MKQLVCIYRLIEAFYYFVFYENFLRIKAVEAGGPKCHAVSHLVANLAMTFFKRFL